MQRHALTLATALATLVVATDAAAQAYKFSPPNTRFSASGTSFVTKDQVQIVCTMTVKMRTNKKGVLKFTSAEFTGGSDCPQAQALPWKVKSPGFESAFIKNLSISSSLGDCTAPMFPMFLTGGTILLSYTFPDCGVAFAAQLPTTPTLLLVPK